MTLEKILSRISEENGRELSRIAEDLDLTLWTIRMEAEEAGQAAYQQIIRDAERSLRSEEARELSRSRIEARSLIREVREDLISETLARTKEVLSGLRHDPSYPDILCRLIEEAGREIGDGDLVVEGDPRDHDLIRERIGKMDPGKTITLSDKPVTTAGGVIVRNVAGVLHVDNTFEARIERFQKDLTILIAGILFREDDGGRG